MILSAFHLSFLVPLVINGFTAIPLVLDRPYIVQAVIDSSKIIGLPSSRAAKAYAKRIQTPDPLLKQIVFTSDPVSDRKLFFRSYFK